MESNSLSCFIDIVVKFFLPKHGSTLLKRNIFFPISTSLQFVNRSTIDRQKWQPIRFCTKTLKKPWNVLSQKLKSDGFPVSRNHNQGLYIIICMKRYVCLAPYSLQNHSNWKRGRGSVTFKFGAWSNGTVQAASTVSFPFPILIGKTTETLIEG